MNLLNYIKEQGFVQVEGREDNYSTMAEHGTYGRYEHEDGRYMYWGFNEMGKPPTLITPRPRILRTVDGVIYDQHRDDVMNYCLQRECVKDVFKAMFNESVVFNY